MMDCEVAVIGGGPSGSVAAALLARNGVDVVLVERTHYQQFRPGEFLSPLGKHYLASLQMLDGITSDVWKPSPGILTCWSDSVPRAHDFILGPYGDGWRLDRRRFDSALCDTASRSGAKCWLDTTVLSASRAVDSWELQLRSGRKNLVLKSRFILITTGRAGLLGVSSKRTRKDKQVAIIGISNHDNGFIDEPRLLIESLPNGWCYGLSIPGGKSIAAFITDRDLIPKDRNRSSYVVSELQQSNLIWHRIQNGFEQMEFTTFSADSSFSSPIPIDGCFVAGDALNALDPLSGNGISFAVRTAQQVAECLLKHRAGESIDRYPRLVH